MKKMLRLLAAAIAVALTSSAPAAITGVVETGLAADPAAIVGTAFGDGSLTYSDRTHVHRAAAFDAGGVLAVGGTNVVPLPAYLVGHPYVRFANGARENAGYSAVVTSDTPAVFYLLVDNRLDGPAGTGTKANTSDPILGGQLQWVIDGGWQRVNTGISPNGQADYTSIDEGNDGTRNQFFSVYRLPDPATTVTVRNNGINGQNNICVIAAPAPITGEPITAFTAAPTAIAPGASATLSWVINTGATAAAIDQGIGSVLPATVNGIGSRAVAPLIDTTYALTVTAGATASRQATVEVRPLAFLNASETLVAPGSPVTLSWRIRPDASATLTGFGNVSALTAPDGTGSTVVNPSTTSTWTLTSTASGRTESASVTIVTRPPGTPFALLDFGGTDGRPEPGALTGAVIGAGPNNTNALPLAPLPLTATTGEAFTLAIDNIDQAGTPVGGLDWRDRGDGPPVGLAYLAEDHVKNNGGVIRVVLSGLPAGTYGITSYHLDATLSQANAIRVLVTDATRNAAEAGVVADASWPGHPLDTGAPGTAGLTSGNVDAKAARFRVTSDGLSDVQIWFDSRAATPDIELPLAGLWITKNPPPDSITSFSADPALVVPGAPATLRWIIAADATSATVTPGPGSILAQTAAGVGSVSVSPLVDTTYSLTVNSPSAGEETMTATVAVRPLASFSASSTLVPSGSPVTLSWRIRPDATASISGVGSIAGLTNPDGTGGTVVNPTATTTYTLTSTAGGRTENVSVTVLIRPSGTQFAILDLGAVDGRPEPGALTAAVIGAGPNNTNAADLPPAPLISDTGAAFSLALDNLDPAGNPMGGLDWRDRGDAPATALALLAEDFVKNNAGMVHVTLTGLPAGTWQLTSFHIDPANSQCPAIRILVTDATRTAADTGILANASWPGHPANTGAPGIAGLTTQAVDSRAARFTVTANGTDAVHIWFDGSLDATDTEVPLAGLWLYRETSPIPVPITSLVHDRTARSTTLTFPSAPGQSFVIEASSGLSPWTRLTLSHPAGAGSSTSFTETDIPAGTDKRFYRVFRN